MRHFFKYFFIGSGCAVLLLIVITIGFKINAKVIHHEMRSVPATVETRVIIIAAPGADISGVVNKALRDYRAPLTVEVERRPIEVAWFSDYEAARAIDRNRRARLRAASERAAAQADSECSAAYYDTVAQKVNGKWRFKK